MTAAQQFRCWTIRHVGWLLMLGALVVYMLVRLTRNDIDPLSEPYVARLLRDSPQVTIYTSEREIASTDVSCSHFTCFDIYRCGHDGKDQLGVYIYPIVDYVDENGRRLSRQSSREFMEMLEFIRRSRFYVNDPRKACVFVPSVDVLDESIVQWSTIRDTAVILNSLPHWNNGTNHILVNFFTGGEFFPYLNARSVGVAIGKAGLIGAGFDSWGFRPSFDISVAVTSYFEDTFDSKSLIGERPWLITVAQLNGDPLLVAEVMTSLPADQSQNVVRMTSCGHQIRADIKRCFASQVYSYPHVLQKSTFCVVLRDENGGLGQRSLVESMAMGCTPIIIADGYVLPFHDIIDWTRIALVIREDDIHRLGHHIANVSPTKRIEMRRQTRRIYERFFASPSVMIGKTLEILEDRVFPHKAHPREYWNDDRTPTLTSYVRGLSSKLRGFTAVILTYDRVESLFKVITRLAETPSLVKIVVVWNNQQKAPPPDASWPRSNVPLKVIRTKANLLSNRFFPYDDIETEAVLAIDDDILMLTPDELEFGFQVWCEHPERIVGFPSRVHRWDNATRRWKYESEWTNDISMVLTGAAFYHQHYGYEYTYRMPAQIREWVDSRMNCEDIAMNFLVANITGRGPLKVAPRKKFKCPECTRVENLSSDLQHMQIRSDCINRFADIYGGMILKTVQFRADPVLYKDNFPEKLKMFNGVGSL